MSSFHKNAFKICYKNIKNYKIISKITSTKNCYIQHLKTLKTPKHRPRQTRHNFYKNSGIRINYSKSLSSEIYLIVFKCGETLAVYKVS